MQGWLTWPLRYAPEVNKSRNGRLWKQCSPAILIGQASRPDGRAMVRTDCLSKFQMQCQGSGQLIEISTAAISPNRMHSTSKKYEDFSKRKVVGPIFAASRAKIDRAREHIASLKDDLAQYIASNPITGKFDDDINPTAMTFHIRDIGLRPGALVGDVVHNLRAALDLVASELARINNQSDKGVYFPFSVSASELPNAIRNKKFDRCGPDAVQAVLDLKPYRGGNRYLRDLHDLDIEDKHTSLIPIAKIAGIAFEAKIDTDRKRAPTVSAKFDKLDYCFPDNMPLAGMAIIPTLEELTCSIDEIITNFYNIVECRKI